MEFSPADAGAPHTYVNGFQLALSNADVHALFMTHNVPVLSLSLSYTTAKSLAVALNEMMQSLEQVTSHTIMTSDEVAIGLSKITGEAE